jgi:hypothetical protein
MISDPYKAMSWEPCILKHCSHYDNPWQRGREAHGKKFSDAIPIKVYDIKTKKTTLYISMAEFSRKTGISRQLITYSRKHKCKLIGKRYELTVLATDDQQ